VTVEQITLRQKATPFQPYSIMLADGRELAIDHPDFVSVSNKDNLITLFDLAGGAEIVDLMLVVSLRYGEQRPTSATRS
jgi:hypothetical protein